MFDRTLGYLDSIKNYAKIYIPELSQEINWLSQEG